MSTATATDNMRLRTKKAQNLNRSDSTGSSSGRKFLAPTLSDPQPHRGDKYSQKKKATNFITTNTSGNTGAITPTGTKPRNQFPPAEHSMRSRSQILRPELTTESEEYEDVGISAPSTSATASKTNNDNYGFIVSYHGSQSMHTFDTQSHNAQADVGRISTLNSSNNINSNNTHNTSNNNNNNNNNSSSTGSNIVAPSSKNNVPAYGASNTTNVAYEVHDWWREQVNAQSSDEDDDE